MKTAIVTLAAALALASCSDNPSAASALDKARAAIPAHAYISDAGYDPETQRFCAFVAGLAPDVAAPSVIMVERGRITVFTQGAVEAAGTVAECETAFDSWTIETRYQ